MVRHYWKMFIYVFVFGVICKGDGLPEKVFIVYPYKEGDIVQSKPKFPAENFENKIERKPKMLDDAKVHLIYPTHEDFVIMTPAPMYDSNESLLESTTIAESSTDFFNDLITTTETIDDDLRSVDENKAETTTSDIESTTIDLITTTDIPIQTETSPLPEKKLLDIFEETGPKKTLRKRMFEATKFSRKYPSNLKMNNDMKIPTTESPLNAFKNWYRKTNRHETVMVLSKTKKHSSNKANESTTEPSSVNTSTTEKKEIKKDQRYTRRYTRTYKRKTVYI
ncbi:uncharacterized protein LOC129919509 [Episyrphus balteatus]|uniref:uncharacterized protein LOC129919509 n=1 Tax=Episyrphus balteatus TaxID=286459 RepID=UPI002486B64C|nr:uncharacterized protein LOC129919509 [Episyrphus balteatus]